MEIAGEIATLDKIVIERQFKYLLMYFKCKSETPRRMFIYYLNRDSSLILNYGYKKETIVHPLTIPLIDKAAYLNEGRIVVKWNNEVFELTERVWKRA